jgi:hypothetical protein
LWSIDKSLQKNKQEDSQLAFSIETGDVEASGYNGGMGMELPNTHIKGHITE